MAVYKDAELPIERLDAAKAAIRFEKPALSSVDSKGNAAPTYIAYLLQGTDTTEGMAQAVRAPKGTAGGA